MAASRPSLPIPVTPACHAVCGAHVTPGPGHSSSAVSSAPTSLRKRHFSRGPPRYAPRRVLSAGTAPSLRSVTDACWSHAAFRFACPLTTRLSQFVLAHEQRQALRSPPAEVASLISIYPAMFPCCIFFDHSSLRKHNTATSPPSNSATQIVRDPLFAKAPFRSRTTCSAPLPPFRSPTRNAQKECSRILPSAVPNAAFSSTFRTQHFERLPRLHTPPAARGRALTVNASHSPIAMKIGCLHHGPIALTVARQPFFMDSPASHKLPHNRTLAASPPRP